MTSNDRQRVTLFLNPRLLKRAKVQAVVEEMSLAVLVEKALIKYLPKEIMINKIDIKKKGGEIICCGL